MTNQVSCAAGLGALTLLSGVAAGAGINETLLAAIRDALQRGAAPNARNPYGTPALMQAAPYADAACIALLLDRGANPNLADSFGAAPLMWSIPDEKKVGLLLRHGANVNAVSATGRTPLLATAEAIRTRDRGEFDRDAIAFYRAWIDTDWRPS